MTDDIEYSLNKHRRWELPDIIEDMILNKEHEEEYNFQLVQRHRIHRTANCVSVAATDGVFHKGTLNKDRRFKTKNSGGFFQADSVLKCKPVKTRRQRRNQRQNQPANNEEETLEGPEQTELPHIRYEVHYPTPETSFLAYHPKSSGQRVKDPDYYYDYHYLHRKHRRRTNVRNTIKESLDMLNDEFLSSESEEEYEEDKNASETTSFDYRVTLEDLMKHANKACSLFSQGRCHLDSGDSISSEYGLPNKGKIIYVEKEEPAHQQSVADKASQARKPAHVDMQSVVVILQNKEVSPQCLEEVYGSSYIEACCFPRKFTLDISNRILETCHQRSRAFLVFVLDTDNEINGARESVFKVSLNAHFGGNIQRVKMETVFDYMETNIEELVKRALFYIETLPSDALEFEAKSCNYKVTSKSTQVERYFRWSSKSYQPDNEFLIHYLLSQSMSDCEEMKADGYEVVSPLDTIMTEETFDTKLPTGMFCSICFEELENQSGTALVSCQHWFCDSCWKEYIYTEIDRGQLNLVCPEYDCKRPVDAGTLISLVNIRDVLRHAKHQHDTQVEVKTVTRWCPNVKCGRVVEVNTESAEFAQCVCGHKFCLQCSGQPHWPASCDTVQSYNNKLRSTGDISLLPDEFNKPCQVNGKNCPHCKRFVEKNGGCPYMYCACGSAFCWGCGQAWESRTHGNACYRQGYKDKHGTRELVIEVDRIEDRKRVGWYKKAVRHRINQHSARIVTLRSKMKSLTSHLQSYLAANMKKGETVTLDFNPEYASKKSEVDKVRDFLRNTLDMYVEMNHIVENTYILLGVTLLSPQMKPKLSYLANRLSFFAETIYHLFMDGVSIVPVKDFLEKIKEVRFYSKRSISNLIHVTKELEN